MNRPHLLFFISTLSVGGAERHTTDLCERLRKRGYPVDILVHLKVASPIMTSSPGGAGAIILGVRGMSELNGWVKVWRTFRGLRPDIIIAVNQTPFIVSVLERFAGATRAKLACIFHTTELQSYEKYQERLFCSLSRFADLLVYVGANQQKVWESRGVRPRRALVIRNGVDLERFAHGSSHREEMRRQLNLGAEDYLLGILAAFRVEKNHVEIVAALAKAKDRGLIAKLLCIGSGPTRQEVETLAVRLGISDQLIFVGEQSCVEPFLAACDAGVLCSTVETFPLSAIEFLATGVPLISAEVSGTTEIVEHDVNGLLYPPGNIDELADAVIELSQPLRRAALAAKSKASVASFSAEQMVDRYVEEFEALAAS